MVFGPIRRDVSIRNNSLCEIGFGLNVRGDGCIPCGMTSFKPTVSNDSCIPCPAGAFCDGTSFTCQIGFGLNQTGTGCTQCGTITYKTTASNEYCIPCPDQAVCDINGQAFKCAIGYIADYVSNQCVPVDSRSLEPSSTTTFYIQQVETTTLMNSLSHDSRIVPSKTVGGDKNSQTVFIMKTNSSGPSPSASNSSNWWIVLWITNPYIPILILICIFISLFMIAFLAGWISLSLGKRRYGTARAMVSRLSFSSPATAISDIRRNSGDHHRHLYRQRISDTVQSRNPGIKRTRASSLHSTRKTHHAV